MKRLFFFLSLCLIFAPAYAADIRNTDHRYILDIVQSLKIIVHQQNNVNAVKAELNRIKGSKSLAKNNLYIGQQIFQSGELNGFVGVKYKNDKAAIAVYSSVPLRVRRATRRYKAYRDLLAARYKETNHNQFDLGDNVFARIKKQERKITIDVYRNK